MAAREEERYIKRKAYTESLLQHPIFLPTLRHCWYLGYSYQESQGLDKICLAKLVQNGYPKK